ncbi:MAG TPA: TIM barrel protein [Tepidisphaeraceae bacterium]|nr:TIM barrel protein [Tepidisphaeraceae bacterium]
MAKRPKIGICSFSFHRLLTSGGHDVFSYIDLCKRLGCTQLDPWNAHLVPPPEGDVVLKVGRNPGQSHQLLSPPDEQFTRRVAEAGRKSGLPVGTICVDGAHIYDPTDEARRANRAKALQWLDAAQTLGAGQVRIDAGGPEDMPPDVFRIIVEGYRDLIARAKPMGIEILIENHWGPAIIPDNMIRLLGEVEGLGLLYDTRNWRADLRAEGRRRCAKYARATHIKTRRWDAQGNELEDDVEGAVDQLLDAGYTGTWGIESVPADGDEIAGAEKTISLIHRLVR